MKGSLISAQETRWLWREQSQKAEVLPPLGTQKIAQELLKAGWVLHFLHYISPVLEVSPVPSSPASSRCP